MHTHACSCTHPQPHKPTCTAQSMGTILINPENSLVRGLAYTSHLSENGVVLMMLIHGESHLVMDVEKQGRLTERQLDGQRDSRRADCLTAWIPSCLHFYTFSPSFCGSRLLNKPSAVSMTDCNNSLEIYIFLLKCESYMLWLGGKKYPGDKGCCYVILRCEKDSVAFSNGEDELQNDIHHKGLKKWQWHMSNPETFTEKNKYTFTAEPSLLLSDLISLSYRLNVCLWQLEMSSVLHFLIQSNNCDCNVRAVTKSDRLCCQGTQ